MASARRRIVFDLSTRVKQRRGGIRREMASSRTIDLSTVPDLSTVRSSRKEMASGSKIDLSTATGIAQRSMTRIHLSPALKQWSIHCNRDLSTNTHYDYDCFREIGYTDVVDLLSSPERDFLVRNHDSQKVPVSSLKGKLVGLYLCENKPCPPRLEAIKKVYEEAKARGYDFEIVQISLDFHGKHPVTDPTVQLFREGINWLILPSMDPSFRKIQRIFQCVEGKNTYWAGDSLVLIHPPQADDSSGLLFDFSGAEILQRWGIEGYPFTRPSLYKAEYELQKREVTLQSLFPPGENILLRPRPGGHGFDLVDVVSQLSGKKVLVLFAMHSFGDYGGNFVSMLKYEYQAQLEDNVAQESKFEVVYVATGLGDKSSFDEFTKDMPWMVQPFPLQAYWDRLCEVFKPCPGGLAAAVAFNEQGELIAKEDCLDEKEEGDNLQFPFIDQDLEKRIRMEVEEMCNSSS